MRHHSRARARRALSVAAGLAVAVAGLASVSPASANPAGTGLVINEVYADGGSAGATYTNKYVELANPTGGGHPALGAVAPVPPCHQHRQRQHGGRAGRHGACARVLRGARAAATAPTASPSRTSTSRRPPCNVAAGGGTLFVANGTTVINPGIGSVTTGVVDLVGLGHLQHLRDLRVAGGQRHDRAEPQRHGVRQRHQRDGLQRAGADPGRGQRHHHAAAPADRVLDRRDPGHRQRHLAPRRRDRDHPGRRDRRLRHRWVQRLLPPDRRHRRPDRRHARRLRRDLRVRLGRPRRRCTSATSSRCRAR